MFIKKFIGHFVSASIVSLVFPLPSSPSPVSSVYIISKNKTNDAKNEEFGEIYAFIPAYFRNGRFGIILVAYVQVIVGVATKQMSNATRHEPHWLIMLLN